MGGGSATACASSAGGVTGNVTACSPPSPDGNRGAGWGASATKFVAGATTGATAGGTMGGRVGSAAAAGAGAGAGSSGAGSGMGGMRACKAASTAASNAAALAKAASTPSPDGAGGASATAVLADCRPRGECASAATRGGVMYSISALCRPPAGGVPHSAFSSPAVGSPTAVQAGLVGAMRPEAAVAACRARTTSAGDATCSKRPRNAECAPKAEATLLREPPNTDGECAVGGGERPAGGVKAGGASEEEARDTAAS